MHKALMEYLPDVLQQVYELQRLASTEEIELKALTQYAGQLLDDQFILEAGDYGLYRWEQLLGITPKATATLDERRFLVQARVNERLPYSLPVLKQQLSALCGGEEGYTVSVDHENYVLTVLVALTAKSNFSDVGALLKRVVPANIVVSLQLKYNQHQVLAPYTHQELSVKTHDQLRNEVLNYGD